MRAPLLYEENLRDVAKLSFGAAQKHCAECRDYHATWTYRRMLGVVGGIDAERPQLMPLLRELVRIPRIGRWLIAGAADSGILATIAASVPKPKDAAFIVVDRCPSPWRSAGPIRFARSRAGNKRRRTRHTCPRQTGRRNRSAFGHNYIPLAEQPAIFARLRDQLRPEGHFILCTRYRSQREYEDLASREARILAAFRAARGSRRDRAA